MSSASDTALAGLGWHAAWEQALAAQPALPGRPVRIIEQHRSEYRVDDGEREFSARTHPALHKALSELDEGLAVGDWARYQDEGGWLNQWLPRRNLLERSREDGRRQRLVANVDTALLVMGLDGDYKPERLERYRLLAVAAQVRPVVLLTKSDRAENLPALRAEIEALVGAGTPVHAFDARSPEAGLALAPYLAPGQTLVLLGSSGVGKSTLMNQLLGREAQRTGGTQAQDDLGRHTTTARFLRRLPGGACLIDTPGLRELKLNREQAQVEDDFSDVRQLAAGCRFNDCRHQREPGCAVTRELSAERLAAYRASLDAKPAKFRRGRA